MINHAIKALHSSKDGDIKIKKTDVVGKSGKGVKENGLFYNKGQL